MKNIFAKNKGVFMEDNKGFTLIELLAVIVILAVIMVIAVMSVNKIIKKARIDSNEINKKTIAKAAKTCLIEESEYVNYCSSIEGLAGLGYLDEFEDPFDKENSSISDLDTKYSITVENNEKINVEYLGTINDKYKIGDKVCINNECFYVIRESETEVTALSVHALDVNENKQSSTNPSEISFSDSNYWNGDVHKNHEPTHVLNEKSLIYPYLQNYKNYLNKKSLKINLLSYKEATILGCTNSSCHNAPSWMLLSKPYYLSTSQGEYPNIISNIYNGFIGTTNFSEKHLIRPLITISKQEL